MAFTVEDGTGVSGANAYMTAQEVTDYLTDRGRETQNGWDSLSQPAQEAAVIAATDYIEQRWRTRFRGNKEFKDISAARATLTFTGQPADTETVTIGTQTYTFVTTLGAADDVLIGDSVSDSIDNLINAVNAVSQEAGVTHGTGTQQNEDATATQGVDDRMIAEARAKGTAGNTVATTTTVANASWSSSTLTGGGDNPAPQPLSFPRRNLVDRDGVNVGGIPDKLKFATAEYAVRSVSAELLPDPVIDDTGRAVTSNREKVGPIETEVKYADGSDIANIIRPYPAADRLLQDYVFPAGRVFRG